MILRRVRMERIEFVMMEAMERVRAKMAKQAGEEAVSRAPRWIERM